MREQLVLVADGDALVDEVVDGVIVAYGTDGASMADAVEVNLRAAEGGYGLGGLMAGGQGDEREQCDEDGGGRGVGFHIYIYIRSVPKVVVHEKG